MVKKFLILVISILIISHVSSQITQYPNGKIETKGNTENVEWSTYYENGQLKEKELSLVLVLKRLGESKIICLQLKKMVLDANKIDL